MNMKSMKEIFKLKESMWEVLRSPKTIAALKLAAAVVGVIHAVDELSDAPKAGKRQIGFDVEDED
jgi:hypothetical protein